MGAQLGADQRRARWIARSLLASVIRFVRGAWGALSLLPLLLLLLLCAGGCPSDAASLNEAGAVAFNESVALTQPVVSGEPVFISEPIFAAIAGRSGSHAPSIVAFSDGELLAAWYSYTGPHELDGSAIYTARRPAGASAWETPVLHIDRDEGDGNPVLYAEGDDVWLFQAVVPFGWSTAHVEVQRSADRGETWSAPARIDGPIGTNVRFPPVRLSEGALLLPAYDDLLQRALVFASDDGDEWDLRATVGAGDGGAIQPSVVQLDDGALLAVMRGTAGWMWVTESDDVGRSWAVPTDSGFPNPGAPAVLLKLASGNLLLVYNDSATDRTPLAVALSGDEGRTWTPARVIVDGDGEYAYPAATQGADGLVHIVYSYNRERIEHVSLNEAWIAANVDQTPQ